MSQVNRFFSNSTALLILLMLFTIPVLLPLTKPGFFPTQDFIHVARIYEMDRGIKDFQVPVRWAADFRYGEPLFNFYAPLPFYFGSLIHNLGFSFIDTTKILFGLSFVLSGLTMFFLARKLFGVMGGLIAGVVYVYAPYHSVDVYVRGALSESLALVFFPLIFLASLRLSQSQSRKNMAVLSLSLAGLFLTHNIMTVLFFPFFIGWVVFLIWRNKIFYPLLHFAISILLGFGLAATFLLPAFFEKDFTQSDKMISGYFDYRGHFVEIRQFFTDSWGYGASLWGAEDGMSFQIGFVLWAVLALSVAAVCISRQNRTRVLLLLFLAAEFLFSLFMQHNKSTPIWLMFSVLAYTQFPWRFLGISIFLVALSGGSLGEYLKQKFTVLGVALVLLVVIVNVKYFEPESYYYDSTDAHYVYDILPKDDKLPKDYLPKWAKVIMSEKIEAPHALSGKVEASGYQAKTASAGFSVNVLEDSDIEVPVSYFPGWEVKANGEVITQEEPSNLGLIRFRLPKGGYEVKLSFTNTPIRTLSNLISLLSVIVFVKLFIHKKLKAKL